MSLEKVIFHIDVNSAFLSWEAVYRLHHLGWKGDLREQVSAVGGDMAMRHGIILAKSIPAKKYRIQTGESILEASHLSEVPGKISGYSDLVFQENPNSFHSGIGRPGEGFPRYFRNTGSYYGRVDGKR